MEKSKKTLITLLATLGILVTSTIAIGSMVVSQHPIAINVEGQDHICHGNHYTGKVWDTSKPGKGSSGYYEYWHCCECDARYFRTSDINGYSKNLWVDNGEVNQYAPKDSSDSKYYTDNRVRFGGGQDEGDTSLHFVEKLESGKSITVDGVRDEAYDKAVKYEFNGDAIWQVGTETKSTSTATLETLWDDDYLYIYVNIKDSTKYTKDYMTQTGWTDDIDHLELGIDTLHSDKFATDNWDGKKGSGYRNPAYAGDLGLACEGLYKIAAGYNSDDTYTNEKGLNFDDWSFMSNRSREEKTVEAKSKYADDNLSYGVEFKIKFKNNFNATGVLNDFGEIGLALKFFDYEKTTDDGVIRTGIINFENFNDDFSKLRNYSNFRLVGWGE